MDNEIWLDIPKYNGYYQASNLGNIRSLIGTNQKKRIKKLKPSKNAKGYLQVVLFKNNKAKTFKVHRLIAEAFIPNHENKPQVNHIDENKQNNCVSNLEWCTNKYNIRYSKAIPVLQYNINGTLIKEWDCIKDAYRELKIGDTSISHCCMHKRKTAGGFKWEYKKEV